MTQDIPTDLPLYEHLGTFMGVPQVGDIAGSCADIIVQGIPFDLATPGRPGTRYGPGAIRLASANLRWDVPRWPWSFDLFDELAIEDGGDIHHQTGHPAMMVERVEQRAGEIVMAGKKLMSFGGDHYVSLPLLRAHHRKHGRMSLLHFDAHTDTYDGPEYDNGTMFHYAVEEGLIDPDTSIQIGIRTAYNPTGYRFSVLDSDWVNNHGPDETLQRIRQVVARNPVYLTFDIDGLDPAFAPGTGTPVVGGFSSNFAMQVLRGLVGLDIVGMDLVEVSPPYDPSGVTSLAGATLALEMLHVWAEEKRRAAA